MLGKQIENEFIVTLPNEKVKLIVFLFFIVIVACNHSPLDKIREHNIKNGGLYYEQEKLDRLGIRGITKDKDSNIHFYVEKIKPDTRKKLNRIT